MLQKKKFDTVTKLMDSEGNVVARVNKESQRSWKLSIAGHGFYAVTKTLKDSLLLVEEYLSNKESMKTE